LLGMIGFTLVVTFGTVVLLGRKMEMVFLGDEFVREKCKVNTLFSILTVGYLIDFTVNVLIAANLKFES